MQADILAEVKRIMDEMAVIYGQDYADNWFNAFNQRMNGFDFEIPDLEDKTFEELNPQGAADKIRDDAAFYEAMGFTPPTTGLTSLDPLETATGMPIIPDINPSTNMPFEEPQFTQKEQDYFDKALAAGFFGSQGGPSQRGMGESGGTANINVTINAPAVTGSEILGQIDDVARNEAQLLKEIYFL